MMKVNTKKVWLFFLVVIIGKTLQAHPHVFIESYLTIKFDNNGLAGFQLKWEFDEMMSSGVILDYDKNGNGTFDPEERKLVKSEVFDYLKNYNYFTEVVIDGKPFTVKYVQNFYPEIMEGKLVYNFFVPCHVRVSKGYKEVLLLNYDEEYFTHININKKNITVGPADGFKVDLSIYKNREKAYYFDNIIPLEAKVIMSAQ